MAGNLFFYTHDEINSVGPYVLRSFAECGLLRHNARGYVCDRDISNYIAKMDGGEVTPRGVSHEEEIMMRDRRFQAYTLDEIEVCSKLIPYYSLDEICFKAPHYSVDELLFLRQPKLSFNERLSFIQMTARGGMPHEQALFTIRRERISVLHGPRFFRASAPTEAPSGEAIPSRGTCNERSI